MKKKILATLLAVCLFVGMAIPAVMAASSDAAGDAKKVSKITLDKAAYEVTVGDPKGIDFAEKIAVYENDTKLVLDHGHIQYSLLANVGDSSDFAINGSVVTALKAGTTATITVFDNYGEKARTTATIKAIAGTVASTKKIESFTFASSLYNLPVGPAAIAEAQEVVIESHPKGTVFGTDADLLVNTTTAGKAVQSVIDALAVAAPNGPGIAVTAGDFKLNADKNKIICTIPASELQDAALITGKNVNVKATGVNYVNAKSFEASTAFRFVTAVPAAGVSLPADVTVKVGEKIDLPKVTFYPTNANVGKALTWGIEAFINDGNAYQYATLNDFAKPEKVIGVNSNTPGKSRLRVALANGSATETIVNVKPANFVGQITPTIPATASVEVGKTYTLVISNLPAGVTATWAVKDAKIATVKAGVVTGVAVGSTEVTATLSTGEVLKSTVTVKAATAPVKPSKPSTNPQTGDSFFANLF